ncbi:hypothetical protein ECC02_009593 [Trypanosoma cruzi]|uniref:Uncharacterized protein n=1 Tax=Trypanosoma cruzi TaxID=5693 RepID=A0A7J6XTQ6_TRYCR|nr:hypothetical protein ECC02_009593 [Trypanosoma cruzi]
MAATCLFNASVITGSGTLRVAKPKALFSGPGASGDGGSPEPPGSASTAVTHTDARAAAQGEHQQGAQQTARHHRECVVRWCGADLHSEGNGEQQGRREVRQTHTEGKPHEERAAARHAPYAAHHARHTLQSTAAGTHTHTQPCRNTNTQMEEGEANRSGTQGSTARTHGESGPSCRHPSRRVRTQTGGGAAHTATQKQSNHNKKERSPHTTWIVGPREVQPIFITKIIRFCFLFVVRCENNY